MAQAICDIPALRDYSVKRLTITDRTKMVAEIIDREEAEERQALESERDTLLHTVRELRAINVEPGISLGLAHAWKAERDRLADLLTELLEVADPRGDSTLPKPDEDPKLRRVMNLVGGSRPYFWIGAESNGYGYCFGTISLAAVKRLLRPQKVAKKP
jgi:hypothetical protein